MEIAIYLGKWKSCVVMKDNGKIVKEGYTEKTKDPDYGKRWAIERIFSRLKEAFCM